MTVVRGIGGAAIAGGVLVGVAAMASALEPGAGAASDAGLLFRRAQFTYPWDEEKKEPKAPRPAKPPGGDVSKKPPATATTPPPGASSVEEVAHKGQVVRALHYASTSTLRIELNGRIIGTVKNVGQMKKPHVLPGTYQSVVTIWTKNAAQDCSSHVLVAVPTGAAGNAEVKSGFGACNTSMRMLSMKRNNWETWSLLAFREDSPKVSVAVSQDGKLAITEHVARPCLFSKDKQGEGRCNDEYLAAGLGSAERGVQSGEERVAGRRLATFQNRAKHTGSIELDGKPYKAFTNVKAFYVESSVSLPDSALFSIWIQPINEPCGYRTLMRVAIAGGEDQTLDRVGVCRAKAATHIRTRPDKTVSSWAKIMWRDGDQRVDVAAWSGGSVTLTVVQADACLFGANVTNECINRILPAYALKAEPGALASGSSISPPAAPSWREQIARNPAVLRAFAMLGQNQIDTALAEFDRALIAEPNNAWAYTGRGFGLALKGKLDNAMADLDRAVQLNPRSAHAFSYRGFVFLLRREPDRALAQLDQALLLDARLPEAYAFRGGAHLAKGDTDRALADLDKSLDIMPKNSVALGMRARVFATRRDHQRAVDDFTAAIALSPSIAYRFGRGQSLEALGRSNEAVADYRAIMSMRPVTLSDIATQAMASQRVRALSGVGAAREGCPKGQTCL